MERKQIGSVFKKAWEGWKGGLARLLGWIRLGWPRFWGGWRLLVAGFSFLLLVALGWGIGRELHLPTAAPSLVVEETGKRETGLKPETPPAGASETVPVTDREDLAAAVEALKEEVAALRQRLETEKTPSPEGETEAAPAPSNWLAPVAGKVVRGSGWEKQGTEWRYHSGVDLSALPGTPVRAAAAGTVETVKTDAALGTVVTLAHGGGWRSLYGHLTQVQVTVGEEVAQGTVLGYSAPAACGSEAGIHFALYQQEDPVNPLAVLSFPPE
ncbi:MAG TPA: peptidoglycan DD-metalloendopeptidase family protein [Capillibacterium sp.]